MKKVVVIVVLLSSYLISGQQINYYNLDANLSSRINANVNVNSKIEKYSTVIDYGKIAEANAEYEKTRLERDQYNYKISQEILKKVSENPALAIDYGLVYYWKPKKVFGIKKAEIQFVFPHLFFRHTNYDYIHTGPKGITTRLNCYVGHPKGKGLPPGLTGASSEDVAKYSLEEGGTYYDGEVPLKVIAVEKDFGSISSMSGYKYSAALEGENQIMITDQIAASIVNGIRILVVVKYTGSKKDVSFIDLKQQQEYFRPLIDKFCSNMKILNYKLEKFK